MWKTLAGPELSRRCWTVIEDIERCLTETEDDDPRLASGHAGRALFLAYLDAARPGTEAGDKALEAIGQSIDAVASASLPPSLFSGFSGVGWALEHLTREMYEGDEDLASEIDAALGETLGAPIENLEYELINGLAGFGTYLLERMPNPASPVLLERVLDRLEESAEVAADGSITWFTRPEWIPEFQRPRRPDGCYNLGVAHGVPGVIGFLAAAYDAGFSDPRIPRFAEGAVRWVLANRLPAGGDSSFPALLLPGKEPNPTRAAWCYGDPGIAAVLLNAARSFGRPDWESEGLALAHQCVRRPTEGAQVDDAGLCHGMIGLSHLYNRLHQATGDPVLRDAALEWLGRGLDLQQPGQGMAGYQAWIGNDRGGGDWYPEPGFLVGVAGIGLGLLAAATEIEPAWDRVLLLSTPRQEQTA